MKPDFLAIGELLADVMTTDYCETLADAKTFHLYPGGSPGNVAANLHFLGKAPALVSAVGADGIGRFLISNLSTIGLDTSYIQICTDEPTSIVLVTCSKGTPDFIAYRGADVQLSPIAADLLQAVSIVHTTAFALSRQPAQAVILNAFSGAKQMGKTLFVDWNFAPSIWGADDGKAVFNKLMDLQPYLKISVDDLERFSGKQMDIAACKLFLDACPAAVICLTCGKDGTWFKEGQGNWQHQAAAPVNEVVDTTGAGDAFWAGFAMAYLDKLPIPACVKKAPK